MPPDKAARADAAIAFTARLRELREAGHLSDEGALHLFEAICVHLLDTPPESGRQAAQHLVDNN